MFSWKELWSIVLILAVRPELAFWKASMTDWIAAFGTASDWLEPTVTVPVAAPPGVVPPSPPHAARSDGAASRVPAPTAPRRRVRRLTPRTEAGTRLARYSASEFGRVIRVSFDTGCTGGMGEPVIRQIRSITINNSREWGRGHRLSRVWRSRND